MNRHDSLLNMIQQLTEELDCMDEELINQWALVKQQYKVLQEDNYRLKATLKQIEKERDRALEQLEISQQDSWLSKLKLYVNINKEGAKKDSLKVNQNFPNRLVSI